MDYKNMHGMNNIKFINSIYFIARDLYKIVTIMHIHIIHSSFCVLKFILPACKPNFCRSCPHHMKGWAGRQYGMWLICSSLDMTRHCWRRWRATYSLISCNIHLAGRTKPSGTNRPRAVKATFQVTACFSRAVLRAMQLSWVFSVVSVGKRPLVLQIR